MPSGLSILEQASGVGDATIRDIKEAGFTSPSELGKLSLHELANRIDGVGITTASNILAVLDEHGHRGRDLNEENLSQLLSLLESLFEFDRSDRDFGVYKLMNERREAVDSFIHEELVETIEREVTAMRDEVGTRSGAVEEIREELTDALGEGALDSTGQVREEYKDVPVAKEYVQAREAAREGAQLDTVEAEIYNHVYQFFNRYYDRGDFITQRYRTQRDPPYSVPYDGSGTHFHWVTKNQYYAKTSNTFTRFSFTPHEYTYRFVTEGAELDGDSIGNSEYFVMESPQDVRVNHEEKSVTVVFYRRKIGESDVERADMSRRTRDKQDSLNEAFADELSTVLAERDVVHNRTELYNKIDQYTARNTADFFIHKHLERFLENELEEYIKAEIVSYSHSDGYSPPNHVAAEKARVVNEVCTDVIDFLSQIESFKRKLFEKKKFINRSRQLVPVAEINEEHYETIVTNEAQLSQWSDSYGVSDVEVGDLATPPHNRMLVDTSLHEASFEISQPPNLLVNGENYQSLSLLKAGFEGSVDCVYIDPPYNTGEARFAYKDQYQRPTWLSMMSDRLALARDLLADDGVIFISIDYHEFHHLKTICDDIFGEENFRNTIAVSRGVKNIQAQFEKVDTLTHGYEYVLFYSKEPETRFDNLFRELDEERTGSWNNHWRGTDRPTMRYELFGHNPDEGQWRWSEERSRQAIENYRELEERFGAKGEKIPDEKIDQWYKEAAEEGVDLLRYNKKNDTVEHYVPPTSQEMLTDEWLDLSPYGYNDAKSVFGYNPYENPKPVALVRRIIDWMCEDGDTVLDFFAGSGTTAHAVMESNRGREDPLHYICVEMLDDAASIIEERVRRLAFTTDWTNGEPDISTNGTLGDYTGDTRHLAVEYLELESYEEALDAVQFTDDGHSTLAKHTDYILNYMLNFETRDSPTLVNADQFDTPFDYSLSLDAQENTPVDLLSTFAHLLGLRGVQSEQRTIGESEYTIQEGETPDGNPVKVIWRHNAQDVDYDAEVDAIDTGGFASVYVNGDSAIPDSRMIAPAFERRMFASVGETQ